MKLLGENLRTRRERMSVLVRRRIKMGKLTGGGFVADLACQILCRVISLLNRTDDRDISGGDEDIDSDDDAIGNDVYEYEEGIPEEESRKNRRFDRVDNRQFELPEDFEQDEGGDDDKGGDE
ncbi:hypothetical protein OROGR_000692 [Orobanche gracilis]